jgi:hypothetical protein
MINETSDIHGNFEEGSICCDNKSCQKVLIKWFDENHAPANDRAGFFAYSVKTRLIFNNFLTNLAIVALSPSIVFSVQDRSIGYIVDRNVLPLKLDFCSTECSIAWLNDDTTFGMGRDFASLKEKKYYGIMIYGENPKEQHQLVIDSPSRFETISIGIYLPTSVPKSQFNLAVGQRINIAGKSFDVRKSNVLKPGEKEPAIGIVMTTLMLKCPMKQASSLICNQVMQVIADFLPSMWICPKCNGLIVFDKESNNLKHSHANLKSSISLGNIAINVNYYFGKPDWGDVKFLNSIKKKIDTGVIAIADPYEDSGIFDNMFISNSLIDFNDIENLFGHLLTVA